MTYAEKLKDPRWQRKRLEVLNRDSFKCRKCGNDKQTLHVHHTGYRNGHEPWEYQGEELLTLCEACHSKQHSDAPPVFRIYLAGKIEKNCWRHKIVDGLRADSEPPESFGNLILQKSILGRHDYCGPYFIGCDHGCGHGDSTHGCKDNACAQVSIGKRHVMQNCLSNLHNSTAMFAWIDSDDCFGTITEIGYARGIGVPVFIGCNNSDLKDLWFPVSMAWDVFHSMSPLGAFRQFIEKSEKPEHSYLLSHP